MSFDLKVKAGDLSISNGDLEIISDRDKLEQDLLKICLTPIGGNPIATWYGSPVSRNLIGSFLSEDILLNTGKNQLINSLETLKKLQQEQFRTGQSMTPGEQIFAVQSVSINRNRVDPTLIDVLISVLSKTFNRVDAQFRLTNF